MLVNVEVVLVLHKEQVLEMCCSIKLRQLLKTGSRGFYNVISQLVRKIIPVQHSDLCLGNSAAVKYPYLAVFSGVAVSLCLCCRKSVTQGNEGMA